MSAKKNTTTNKAKATNPATPHATHAADAHDLLDTLQITKTTRRPVGGTWVVGTIGGHNFEALVFEGHAEVADYEMAESRISKFHLSIRGECVACFDRGWDRKPTTDAARAITDLLAAGLAEHVFGK